MSEHTHEVTDSNFEESVLKSAQPVLVDFWAEWCGPCRMIAPTVEALAADYDGRVTVGKMNVDDNPATPGQYGVRLDPDPAALQGRPGRRVRGGPGRQGEAAVRHRPARRLSTAFVVVPVILKGRRRCPEDASGTA